MRFLHFIRQISSRPHAFWRGLREVQSSSWAGFGAFFFAAAAALFAEKGLREYDKQNELTRNNQLYAVERELAEKESSDKSIQRLYADISIRDVGYLAFAQRSLALLPGSDLVVSSENAADLYNRIYGEEAFKAARDLDNYPNDASKVRLAEQHASLFRSYLHAEKVLYHMQVTWDFYDADMFSDDEWQAWSGLLRDIGRHPIFLANLHLAFKRKYISRTFAVEIRRQLCENSDDPAENIPNKIYLQKFIPELFKQDKIDSLPDYSDDSLPLIRWSLYLSAVIMFLLYVRRLAREAATPVTSQTLGRSNNLRMDFRRQSDLQKLDF